MLSMRELWGLEGGGGVGSVQTERKSNRDGHLEVGAGDTSGDLLEERLLDLNKLGGLNHVQNLLQLTQKHDLQEEQNVRTYNGYTLHKINHVYTCTRDLQKVINLTSAYVINECQSKYYANQCTVIIIMQLLCNNHKL